MNSQWLVELQMTPGPVLPLMEPPCITTALLVNASSPKLLPALLVICKSVKLAEELDIWIPASPLLLTTGGRSLPSMKNSCVALELMPRRPLLLTVTPSSSSEPPDVTMPVRVLELIEPLNTWTWEFLVFMPNVALFCT